MVFFFFMSIFLQGIVQWTKKSPTRIKMLGIYEVEIWY